MTDTRKKCKLWPFDESFVETDLHFHGSKPPTNQEVLRNFISQHNSMQAESKWPSTKREPAKLTAEAVVKWWLITAGYKCMSTNTLIGKIHNLNKTLKNLTSEKKKVEDGKRKATPGMKLRVDNFIALGKETFWAVSTDYEKYLHKSLQNTNDKIMIQKITEDLKFFLENMRCAGRPGSI